MHHAMHGRKRCASQTIAPPLTHWLGVSESDVTESNRGSSSVRTFVHKFSPASQTVGERRVQRVIHRLLSTPTPRPRLAACELSYPPVIS